MIWNTNKLIIKVMIDLLRDINTKCDPFKSAPEDLASLEGYDLYFGNPTCLFIKLSPHWSRNASFYFFYLWNYPDCKLIKIVI